MFFSIVFVARFKKRATLFNRVFLFLQLKISTVTKKNQGFFPDMAEFNQMYLESCTNITQPHRSF
tara:strand:+ start:167 stop:361 length:195 start_codon:yes stop_codon:yes gene_type:complete